MDSHRFPYGNQGNVPFPVPSVCLVLFAFVGLDQAGRRAGQFSYMRLLQVFLRICYCSREALFAPGGCWAEMHLTPWRSATSVLSPPPPRQPENCNPPKTCKYSKIQTSFLKIPGFLGGFFNGFSSQCRLGRGGSASKQFLGGPES